MSLSVEAKKEGRNVQLYISTVVDVPREWLLHMTGPWRIQGSHISELENTLIVFVFFRCVCACVHVSEGNSGEGSAILIY